MPAKNIDTPTAQISVTLPLRVMEMLAELAEMGPYGSSRSEVARMLLMDRLEDLHVKGIIDFKKRATEPRR